MQRILLATDLEKTAPDVAAFALAIADNIGHTSPSITHLANRISATAMPHQNSAKGAY